MDLAIWLGPGRADVQVCSGVVPCPCGGDLAAPGVVDAQEQHFGYRLGHPPIGLRGGIEAFFGQPLCDGRQVGLDNSVGGEGAVTVRIEGGPGRR